MEKRGRNGEIVRQLIEAIILNDATIIYSDVVATELKNLGHGKKKKLQYMPKPHRIKQVITTKEEIKEARKIARQKNIPLRDIFHAILARDHEAQLVSRDARFLRLRNITKAKSPEDILKTSA